MTRLGILRGLNFPVVSGEYFQIARKGCDPTYNPIFLRVDKVSAIMIKGFTGGAKFHEGRTFLLEDDAMCCADRSCKLVFCPGSPNMRYHVRRDGYRVVRTSKKKSVMNKWIKDTGKAIARYKV